MHSVKIRRAEKPPPSSSDEHTSGVEVSKADVSNRRKMIGYVIGLAHQLFKKDQAKQPSQVRILGLTATPVVNELREGYSLLRLINYGQKAATMPDKRGDKADMKKALRNRGYDVPANE